MCKVFPLLRRVKRDTYCILVGDFEVRVRVRRVIRQKAHVRAKCVRGKTSKCGVRACDGKFIALQHSGFYNQMHHENKENKYIPKLGTRY